MELTIDQLNPFSFLTEVAGGFVCITGLLFLVGLAIWGVCLVGRKRDVPPVVRRIAWFALTVNVVFILFVVCMEIYGIAANDTYWQIPSSESEIAAVVLGPSIFAIPGWLLFLRFTRARVAGESTIELGK